MNQLSASRIDSAKRVSKEVLIDKIKRTNPILFDQIIIEEEIRETYYYVHHKAVTISRTPLVIISPNFSDVKSEFQQKFEGGVSVHGAIKKIPQTTIFTQFQNHGITASVDSQYSKEKLPFDHLNIETTGREINTFQSSYFVPSGTTRQTCNECGGNKYVKCTNHECNGRHIYDCTGCHATGVVKCNSCNARGYKDCSSCNSNGLVTCGKCKGRGEYTCRSCDGKGIKKCVTCNQSGNQYNHGRQCYGCGGRGYNSCSNCNNGIVRCEACWAKGAVQCSGCSGEGRITCKKCTGRGEITCSKCNGNRQIVCATCYGDNIDGRYGKVDCTNCQTTGEIIRLSYVNCNIASYNQEFIVGESEDLEYILTLESLKKYAKVNTPCAETLYNVNGLQSKNYDEVSANFSKIACANEGIGHFAYPKLLQEEMYYEAIPCVTFKYLHILTASYHYVSILAIDNEMDIYFHSNPTYVPDTQTFFEKYSEWFKKAFSTKAYKNKIDRKHEMLLLIQIARVNGELDDHKKRYLAKSITGLDGFTKNEKKTIFDLMSTPDLPKITPQNAYFYSKQIIDEVKIKINDIIGKDISNYTNAEKTKKEEIFEAINNGKKYKPNALIQFFKIWQVSLPIVTLCTLLIWFLSTQYQNENKSNFEVISEGSPNQSIINIKEEFKDISNDSKPLTKTDTTFINNIVDSNQSDRNNLIIKKIEDYYYNWQNNTLDVNAFFASKVNVFFNKKNISLDELDDVVKSNFKEFTNFVLDIKSINYEKREDEIYYFKVYMHFKCYRVKMQKNEECDATELIGVNDQNQIVYVKEIKIENLKFY